MKAFNFFFDFAVLCALLGVGIWMLTDGNWVFGSFMLIAAGVQGYRFIRNMKN